MKEQKAKEESVDFNTGNPGVCYVGHIPRGFNEDGMKRFFSQFGKVNKLRVARSKKTGEPKGYAFMEFENEGAAIVAAKTMNGYLMFNKRLICEFLPLTKVHPKTFKGSQRAFKKPTSHVRARLRHNSPKTPQTVTTNQMKGQRKTVKKLGRLAELGIDFEYPGLVKVTNGEVCKDTKAAVGEEEDMAVIGEEAGAVIGAAIKQEAVELLNKSSSSDDEEEAPRAKRARNSSPAKPAESPMAKKSPKVAKVTPMAKKSPQVAKGTPMAKKSPQVAKGTPMAKKSPKVKGTPQAKKSPKDKKTPKAAEKQTPATRKSSRVTPKTKSDQQTPKTTPSSKKSPKAAQTPLKSAEKQKKTPVRSAQKKRKSTS